MKNHLGLLIAAFGLWLVVCVDAEACGASTANDCLTRANAEQLPPTDKLGAYCQAAAALVYKINVCLKNCNFATTTAIQNLTARINNACAATSDCRNVVSLYSDYASCFDNSSGLQSVIERIIAIFNARERTDTLCRLLSSGRWCQKSTIAKCPLFTDLDKDLFIVYPLLASVQHICGSENVPDPRDDSACNRSDAMAAEIEKNCNIACSISATPNPVTICAFLQDQANCILRHSQGCTEVERRFLLPRLNTYAIINLLLPCSTAIQIRGVTVQPAGLSPDYPESFRCSYIPQINDCFQLDLSDSIRADALEKLFNGNFLLDQFCQLQSDGKLNREKLLKSCEDMYLRCRLPVAEVYPRPSMYDNSYGPSLGPFPLDAWGLKRILSALTCPNPQPPSLCPSVKQTVRQTAMATQPSLRPTPAVTRRSTPVRRPLTPSFTKYV